MTADIIDLAIGRLEAEQAARIQAKIDAGKAVRRQHAIVVAALDPKVDYNAVYRDADGIEHYPPADISVIISGVQRGDDPPYVATPSDDRYVMKTKPVKQKRFAPRPPPELPVSSQHYPVRCTVRGPDPEKDDPGAIAEASYTITGNVLRVYAEGRMIGTSTVQAGDDLEAAARAVVRENHGKHTAFYDPIYYRGSVV